MRGWKTWVGGIGMLLSGISMVIAGILADPIDFEGITQGFAIAATGFATVGIGHKIDKIDKVD